ncbi:unnamed protein product [Candidula unifasciata]|uniref:Ion transport domain-containing protein n=1 Tax=Candidula unifasciata TaxID=100452 RepID=A0A8S3YPJ1_9EUPU|nr:unnamed protein product [Candidula unifasciata]
MSFKLLLSLGVNVTALLFALPFAYRISTHFQWNCAAICIFLSWFSCLINLQRFDLVGIYVVMFMEILKTLVKVLLIFSMLNIAFGLAFYVVMSHEVNKARTHWYMSVYHTFIMLLELDYQSTYSDPLQDSNDLSLHFPTVTFLLLIIFILLMPILLTNLLIGLAVGDIEAVQREARLKQLATQVSFHSGAESVSKYLRGLTDERLKFYPNKFSTVWMMVYSKLVSGGEVYTRDTYATEGDTVVNSQLAKTNTQLNDIQNKLDKNIALMNQIMKRLHMNIEDDMWDEGGTDVDGIGEIEETKSKKVKEPKAHGAKL